MKMLSFGIVVIATCRIFTAITKSHPQFSEVIKSDLEKCLPSLQDIQSAFIKVRQICVVGEPNLLSKLSGCWHKMTCAVE